MRITRRAHQPMGKRRVKEEVDGKHSDESSQCHIEYNSSASLSRDYAVDCRQSPVHRPIERLLHSTETSEGGFIHIRTHLLIPPSILFYTTPSAYHVTLTWTLFKDGTLE